LLLDVRYETLSMLKPSNGRSGSNHAAACVTAHCRSRICVQRMKLPQVALGIVLFVAALVRILGITYDLPYIFHADEPTNMQIILRIFRSGDLNPHFFNYPSLFFYLHSLAYVPYYSIGTLVGGFHAPTDVTPPITLIMGTTLATMPTTVIMGRLVSLAFGIVLVGATYAAGRLITESELIAVLGALLVALSPTAIEQSRLITPDIMAAFFAMLALWACGGVYRHGKLSNYLLAGFCVGLTASVKYNGGLVALTLVGAHSLRSGRRFLADARLYGAMVAALLGFVITTPFAILDLGKFIADIQIVARHYSTGHAGMEGGTLWWYLRLLAQTGGVLYGLSLIEVVRGLVTRSRSTILIAVFPVCYFIFINRFVVRNAQTILLLMPFALLLSASLLVSVWQWFARNYLTHRPRAQISAGFCVLLLALVPPLARINVESMRLYDLPAREQGRLWIIDHIPPSSKMMLESYSPWVQPGLFDVQTTWGMIDHEPQWYIDNQFDYLVFSSPMYGRYYNEPGLYAGEIARYDALFNAFHLESVLIGGGGEVRVYRVR